MKKALCALVLIVVVALSSCIGGGGCPWLHASAVTITPATPCLAVSVSNANGAGPGPGGCVVPDLAIVNGCADTLVIPSGSIYAGADAGVTTDDAGAIEIPPGTTAGVEVPDQHTKPNANDYTVNATLGTQALTFTFATSR